jgi:hypothetical protein
MTAIANAEPQCRATQLERGPRAQSPGARGEGGGREAPAHGGQAFLRSRCSRHTTAMTVISTCAPAGKAWT